MYFIQFILKAPIDSRWLFRASDGATLRFIFIFKKRHPSIDACGLCKLNSLPLTVLSLSLSHVDVLSFFPHMQATGYSTNAKGTVHVLSLSFKSGVSAMKIRFVLSHRMASMVPSSPSLACKPQDAAQMLRELYMC